MCLLPSFHECDRICQHYKQRSKTSSFLSNTEACATARCIHLPQDIHGQMSLSSRDQSMMYLVVTLTSLEKMWVNQEFFHSDMWQSQIEIVCCVFRAYH